jgi:hypothetical protein
VDVARALVDSALDELARAERVAPAGTIAEVVRLAEADATGLAGRLTALAQRLERPRPAA